VIPLDAHAHVPSRASTREVTSYAPAVVLAVTGSSVVWPSALRRRDSRVAWGIGCHPADARALDTFTEGSFAKAAKSAAFVGEVGLDGRSPVPRDVQRRVFSSVLRVARGEGLVVSVHSLGRIDDVLDMVEGNGGAKVILHWWTGSHPQTERAVRLGCFFSVNGVARQWVLAGLPRDRVLTETDYPFTKQRDSTATAPGRVTRALALLASAWNEAPADVITRTWRALSELDASGRLGERCPVLRDELEALGHVS
jgi:TatD DNase family protein